MQGDIMSKTLPKFIDQESRRVTRPEGDDCFLCEENIHFGSTVIVRTEAYDGELYCGTYHPKCLLLAVEGKPIN
jgi:hypothetical protein